MNEVKLPATVEKKWAERDIKKGARLQQGIQRMKITVTGPSGAYVLDSIRLKKFK